MISVRDLDKDDKERIRKALTRGDRMRIAQKVSVGYQQVLNVLSPHHPTDNDEVWEATIDYLASLPKVEFDERIAFILNPEKEAV